MNLWIKTPDSDLWDDVGFVKRDGKYVFACLNHISLDEYTDYCREIGYCWFIEWE